MKYTKVIFFLGAIFMISCSPGQKAEAGDVKAEIKELSETIRQDAQKQWVETKQRAEELSNAIDEKIVDLDRRLENNSEKAVDELKERRAKLVDMKNSLSQKIDAMGDEFSEDWKEVVEDTKKYFSSVEESIRS